MDSKLFIFILGSISTLYWTRLPNFTLTLCLVCLAIVALLFQKTRIWAFALFGLCWMASLGHWQYSLQLPLAQIKQAIWVEGKVQTLEHEIKSARFNLNVEKINHHALKVERSIRLTWNQPLWSIKQGQQVRLLVKLKPPHGLANQGGFNYQQWLFSENISATGYVKVDTNNSLINEKSTFRQQLLDSLLTLHLKNEKWIAALTLGYRGMLQDQDWTLVQSTGIAHLIAISGLHLALVATLSYFFLGQLLGLILSRFDQLQIINLHNIAIIGTLFTTYYYAAMAGFALPTVRAWLMLSMLVLIFLANLNIRLSRVLLLCISGFILVFPLSLFGLSFWLSFSAVLIIIFVFWRWPSKTNGFSLWGSFKVMVRIQLALSVLMLPIIAWQFSYISWISPLVNLIAVPVVTMILVPLCLLAILCLHILPDVSLLLFTWVDQLLSISLNWLISGQSISWGLTQLFAIPLGVWLLSLIAIVALMLPSVSRARPYIMILFLPLVSFGFDTRNDDWQVDVLDVGQGTAILVSKQGRALIYDVGPAYPSGFNMAQSVIIPLLKARGIKNLDYVIISHWDNDHSGSLPYLQKSITIDQQLTTSDLCRAGQSMTWQGLHLDMLWPDDPALYNDNNGSCVVKITDGQHSVLLPGDIDASIEMQLVEKHANKLQSDILVAPHHGSNSSSSAIFIQHVAPRYAVFTQGFMNRWGFPRPKVLQRYANNQVRTFSTSDVGQVNFRIKYQSVEPINVASYRQNIYPRWYANFP